METPLTPLEFQRRTRKLYATKEAVVDGTLRLTYAAFFSRCDRWSAALQRLGITKGDKVAYLSPNTHAQLESFYAVPQIGAVLVPINFRLNPAEFEYIINHSEAKVVCVHKDYLDAVDTIRANCPNVQHFVALEGAGEDFLDYEALLAVEEPLFEAPAIKETDLLTINYTSGTTSRPKGVMITHRNAYINIVGVLIHWPMTSADRYLWTLPMFHANGWTFTWLITAIGGTHICLRALDPELSFRLMREEGVTHMCAAPTVLIMLANAPADKRGEVRRGIKVITAGAPPAAATIQRVEGEFGWDLLHAYGLTETSPFMTVCEPQAEHKTRSSKEQATIKARQGVEIMTAGALRIVDESEHDVPRDGQTLGEIIMRGNVIMAGYYNDPKATATAMRGGWFHSGDAAVMHPDGYIEIRDRFKDVIISGGENISSVEVEGVMMQHPSICEIAVIGVPDEQWGETPCAFVVLNQGTSATDKELISYAREKLAHFKAPRKIVFVDQLPKTATGKIQKYVLRQGQSSIGKQ